MEGNSMVADIRRLTEEKIIQEVDGVKFSPVQMYPVTDSRTAKPLKVHSLEGLVDYVVTDVDSLERPLLMVVVESPDRVRLVTKMRKDSRLRDEMLTVELVDDGPKFGRSHDLEEFIIQLKSQFVENDAQKQLISFVSRLTSGSTLTCEDDGVTQTATVKKGISGALRDAETISPIIALRPYRTFRDVEQPESHFLFRMKDDGRGTPICALYEADGGAWRQRALENIRQFIVGKIDVAVVA